MPDDPRSEFGSPPGGGKKPADRPFPPAAYVLGWLAICIVAAEGVNTLLSGVYGTGIILICLVPAMLWLMYVRPHRSSRGNDRS